MQRRIPKKCRVDGCTKSAYAKGLCKWHYWRDRKEKERKKESKTPRKRINSRSRSKRKEDRQYAIYRRDFLEKHPFCAVQLPGCTLAAGEVHHSEGRLGDKYLDISTWVPICSNCHEKIHGSYTAWAYENGFLKSRLKKENMNLFTVKEDKNGRYIEAVISFKIRLNPKDLEEVVSEKEAEEIFREYLNSCNVGDYVINADIKICS